MANDNHNSRGKHGGGYANIEYHTEIVEPAPYMNDYKNKNNNKMDKKPNLYIMNKEVDNKLKVFIKEQTSESYYAFIVAFKHLNKELFKDSKQTNVTYQKTIDLLNKCIAHRSKRHVDNRYNIPRFLKRLTIRLSYKEEGVNKNNKSISNNWITQRMIELKKKN